MNKEKMNAVLLRAVPYCMYCITVAAIIIIVAATKITVIYNEYMVVHHGVVDAFFFDKASCGCGGW